jgi:hypothetical protein
MGVFAVAAHDVIARVDQFEICISHHRQGTIAAGVADENRPVVKREAVWNNLSHFDRGDDEAWQIQWRS